MPAKLLGFEWRPARQPIRGVGVKPVALVIDDHDGIREMLSIALRDIGCEVLTEGDGDSALRRIVQDRPDLILLDLRLPGKDGLEVVAELRRQRASRPPAIIALTGYAVSHRREFVLSSGCDAFFEKPVDIRELQRTVTDLLDRAKR